MLRARYAVRVYQTFCWTAVAATVCGTLSAATIQLKDGRQLTGSIGKIAKLADNPLKSKGEEVALITLVDDELRRVFLPTSQILRITEVETGEIPEQIAIRQAVARSGSRINRVGPIVKISPFDQFGRRTFTMMSEKGPLDVVQGVTKITPLWTRVEGLITKGKTPLIWDMRLATSSLPRDQLHAILARYIDPKNLEQRLRVVRLFLQQDRYLDAQKELEGVIKDFPDQKDLEKQVQSLRQLYARSIVREIDVRRQAGQHNLARALLEKFPTEDVAGETLEQVREMLGHYKHTVRQIEELLSNLKAVVDQIEDPSTKQKCQPLLEEMGSELNINTLGRMATYQRLAEDPSLAGQQKLALAVSGWLLGSENADPNLIVALSLIQVRSLIRSYLNEPVKLERDKLFEQFGGLEGATVATISKLIAHMKPPLETPTPSPGSPGFYKLQVPVGIDREPDVTYFVQLPPQYDPLVRYPTLVTLNGAGTTPENQVDWWAGDRDANGVRQGQGTRFGYIVIAIDWLKAGQKDYEFSAREHAAVLASLRDACRRFSIDTDRVFISGHSAGGNAAWDLGLAHPDLWAGVIPIVGESQQYCSRYWKNAKLVPFYVLQGEMDGDKVKSNATDLDRYITGRFDVTVVEYRGRGHEDFHDDIQNLFDWMNRRPSRNFFPKEFTVSTMRSWDNYFWWFEAQEFHSRGIVDPAHWPPARGVQPVQIEGRVLATNGVSVSCAGSAVSVWLSPEVVDFNRPIKVTINGNAKSRRIEPDLLVLLEDARTRADRQHPFWTRFEP
jgi:predicted esterase